MTKIYINPTVVSTPIHVKGNLSYEKNDSPLKGDC